MSTDTDDLVAGAVDMHCHFGPDAHLERSVDCLEAAQQARGLGMAAIVLKSHDYQTAALAYAIDKVTPGIRVFGGIALDAPVGGINPHAVEVMCRIGGKVVWMPTLSSENDHRKFRDQAWTFLSWTVSKEGMEIYTKGGRGASPRLDQLGDPAYQKFFYPWEKPEVFLETVKLAKTDVAVNNSEATSIFNREMDLAYLGRKSVQDAMKAAKAEIDPLLEGGERC